MMVTWFQRKTYLLHNLSLKLLKMLREVLKLIAYKSCAFLDLPGHIHKYIWNVVIKKFTIFQNYFSKKNSSSRDELDEDIFIQEFCKDW